MGAPARRTTKPRSSPIPWLLGFFSRLLVWYTLYNAIFKCPTDLSEDSPAICHGVQQVKDALLPHVKPYYDEYAAEYVDKATPYIEQATPYVLHAKQAIVLPALEKGTEGYEKYGKPQVEKFRKAVEPTATWYAQEYRRIYKTYLEKHVGKGLDVADQARKGLLEFNERTVIPAYHKSAPHARRTYYQARELYFRKGLPYIKHSSSKAWSFFYQFVWSPVVKFYREYVEVQIGRIMERFIDGSSQEEHSNAANSKLSSVSEKIASSASSIVSQAPPADITSSLLSKASGTAKPSQKGRSGFTKEEERTIIEADLKSWREKFQTAADKAIADLNAQIDSFVDSAYEEKKASVEAEFAALDKMVASEIRKLKATIINLAQGYHVGPDMDENRKARDLAFEKLFTATRESGTAIRDKIWNLRNDCQNFSNDVMDKVTQAADAHVDVVDGIIDMGVQEVGMKWAWKLDGVTYKDWKRYHELKKDFSDIRTPLVKAAENNEKLNGFSAWVEKEWEDKAVAKAKEAADELARLKRIGKKKIEQQDPSEDFSDETYLKHVIKSSTKESNPASPEDYVQKPLVLVATEAEKAMTKASKVIVGGASAGAVKGEKPIYEEDPEDDTLVEKAQAALDEISRAVSEAIYGTATATDKAAQHTSVASDKYRQAMEAASKALYGTQQHATESTANGVAQKYRNAVAAASAAIYGTHTPTTDSSKPIHESIISQAGEYAAAATDSAAMQAEKVKKLVEELLHGKEPTFSESVMKRFSEAYHGTEPGYLEKATNAVNNAYATIASSVANATPAAGILSGLNVAQGRFEEIIDQASIAIYGTPKGTIEQATEAAASAVESASSRLSEAIYGTKTAAYESAAARLSAAASSASASLSMAIYGTPKGRLEQASSTVAQLASSAASAVSDAYSTATAAAASAVDSAQSLAGSAYEAAQSQIDAAQAAASRALLGEEESRGYAQIASAYDAAQKRLSEVVYGTDVKEGYLDQATKVVESVVSEATEAVADASSKVRDEL